MERRDKLMMIIHHLLRNDKEDDEWGYIALTYEMRNRMIDLYRQNRCLWDPQISDFQDRVAILAAKIQIGK